MSVSSDLVHDSRLDTTIRQDGITVHTYLEAQGNVRRVRHKEYWERQRRIGRGGYGQVHLQKCVAGRSEGRLRAVKILDKPAKSAVQDDFHAELEALAKFSRQRYSTWFIQSFGWYEDAESIFIAMEYCRYGDLHTYIEDGNRLPHGESQQVAFQMVEGLFHMHRNNFVHRDVKPKNMLIKSKPPAEWWIVLSDFGISKRIQESHGPSTVRGTQGFMAPELLGLVETPQPRALSDFKACDMWAAGEVMVRTLIGKASFQNFGQLQRFCSGMEPSAWTGLTLNADKSAKDLISRLMTPVASERMTAAQALDHVWLRSLRQAETEEPTLPPQAPNPASATAHGSIESWEASNRWTSATQVSNAEIGESRYNIDNDAEWTASRPGSAQRELPMRRREPSIISDSSSGDKDVPPMVNWNSSSNCFDEFDMTSTYTYDDEDILDRPGSLLSIHGGSAQSVRGQVGRLDRYHGSLEEPSKRRNAWNRLAKDGQDGKSEGDLSQEKSEGVPNTRSPSSRSKAMTQQWLGPNQLPTLKPRQSQVGWIGATVPQLPRDCPLATRLYLLPVLPADASNPPPPAQRLAKLPKPQSVRGYFSAPLFPVLHNGDAICDLKVASEQNFIATLHLNGTIAFWRMSRKRGMIEIERSMPMQPSQSVHGHFRSLILSNHSRSLVIKDNTDGIVVWSTVTRKVIRTFGTKTYYDKFVVFSPDSKLIAATELTDVRSRRRLQVWSVDTGRALLAVDYETPGKGLSSHKLWFSRDGRHISVHLRDLRLMWHIASGEVARYRYHWIKAVRELYDEMAWGNTHDHISEDLERVTRTSDVDAATKISFSFGLSTERPHNIKLLRTLAHERIADTVLSLDLKWLAVRGKTSTMVRLVDVINGSIRELYHPVRLKRPKASNLEWRMVFSENSALLAVHFGQYEIVVWTTASGSRVHTLNIGRDDNYELTAMAFSKDGSLLVVSRSDQAIVVWDVRNIAPF